MAETNVETEVQVYNFEGNDVRTMVMDSEPWFLGRDIAEALEYATPQKALRDHVDDEDKKTLMWRDCSKTEHLKLWSGKDHTGKVIINESGMYSLIMGSKLESAKRFKHWVTSEVLPSIRKHGAYMTDATLDKVANNPDLLIKLATNLKEEREARSKAELQIESEKPDVQFAKAVGNAKSLISVGDMANILSKNGVDIGRTRLYDWMRKYHLVQQRSCKPTQYSINSNVLKVQETHSVDSYGHDHVNVVSRVTTKGQKYILQKFDIVGGEINLLNEGVE